MRKAKRLQKNSKTKKTGNIGFLFAIPALLVLAALSIIAVSGLVAFRALETKNLIYFGAGIAAAIILARFLRWERFKTFIHESKHGIVVLLTGNSIRGMRVGSGTGHIDFMLRSDKLHFAPLIMLAPYFWPLFSLPILIVAVCLPSYQLPLLFVLGLSLAYDMLLGFGELHPHQTDIKRMFGGFIVAGFFLASFHLFWTFFCLIWVLGGNDGYIVSWTSLIEIIDTLF